MRCIHARLTFTSEFEAVELRMIKFFKILLGLAICGCALCLLGCKKEPEANVDASRPLEQSFQTAEPEAKQAIAAVKASLQSGNYAEAARAVQPVLTGRKLTTQQREAVGLMFQQISRAVAANPALDSKELYELRVKLAHAARGERF
jgi:hypothetical protein